MNFGNGGQGIFKGESKARLQGVPKRFSKVPGDLRSDLSGPSGFQGISQGGSQGD